MFRPLIASLSFALLVSTALSADTPPNVVVILTDDQCKWLYHPYDGGADVLAPSTATRDQVAVRHRSWLSKRPDGL